MNKQIKGLIEILIVVFVFLFLSYIIQQNIELFESFVTSNFIGIIVYILIEIASIVIAPITTLPLIVVASNLWGWFFAALLSIIGWSIGAWIAFILARKYGVKIIQKFISLEKINKIERKIPKEHLFWTVVLLRIATPTDVLSYALGIFTKMKTRDYIIATIIGITPLAFLFAYLGAIPILYQLMLFLTGGILIIIGWILKIGLRKCFFWEDECKMKNK